MSVCLNVNVQEDFSMIPDHHHLLHSTLHHHNNNTSSDDDDDDLYAGGKTVRAPFIRSTSLKTGKTPPNSPGRSKKAVRFADSLGLEFECVKLISQDELPTVPRSAYQDLKLKDFTKSRPFNNNGFEKRLNAIYFNNNNNNTTSNIISNNNLNYRSPITLTNSTNSENTTNSSTANLTTDSNNNNNNHLINLNTVITNLSNTAISSKPKPQRKISPAWPTVYNPNCPNTLIPEFLPPIASIEFCDRVRSQRVCLENCSVSSGAGNISVTCVVRVLNIAFEKSVIVRHTLNEWQTSSDSLASYLPNSCDGWSDKFSATFSIRSVSAGGTLTPGQRVSFAVCFKVGDNEYWDNNSGENYSLYASII